MTLDNAFSLFRSRAVSRGLTDLTEREHPEAFGSRYIEASHNDGTLRLVWDGKDEVLRLEITHGPPEGPRSWLDLFRSSCRDGELILAQQEDISVESAIDYGMDLMQPERGMGAA